MAYEPYNWTTASYVNPTNMNHLEQGVAGASADASKRRMYYGTCSTAAGTATKVVTISTDQGFILETGATIVVKFTATNTASNVKLNVNNTGAKSIYFNNGVYTGNSNTVCGYANRMLMFIYDGTNWAWISHGTDLNTWTANSATAAGYVASAANQKNKVWKTDSNGAPAWRDENISAEQVTQINDDLAMLNSKLNPTSYTTPSNKESIVTEINRGYFVIGNVVYVDLSFRTSGLMAQDQTLFKLPAPKSIGSMMSIGQYGTKGTYSARVSADGTVRTNSGTDNYANEFFMTGHYIKA